MNSANKSKMLYFVVPIWPDCPSQEGDLDCPMMFTDTEEKARVYVDALNSRRFEDIPSGWPSDAIARLLLSHKWTSVAVDRPFKPILWMELGTHKTFIEPNENTFMIVADTYYAEQMLCTGDADILRDIRHRLRI